MKHKTKTHFFVGTGGVGKTTLASVYALKLAQENPSLKIKIVTIDPSNRLRSFFGMVAGQNQTWVGNLSVHLNDRSELLKSFVAQSAKKQQIDPNFIFSNKLFSSLMEGLAVSQEFSSLYELYSSHRSADFDFVIIDTPPLQNTSDFLDSSELLKEFFSSSLAKFFLSQDDRGILYKMVNSARRSSLRVLASLTGSDFVDELSFFFKVIEFLREDLLEVIEESEKILSQEARVNMVCNAGELSLCGLRVALENLRGGELNLKTCFINKYDKKKSTAAEIKKIQDLKNDFPSLTYVEIPLLDSAPSSYKDLIESLKHVSF